MGCFQSTVRRQFPGYEDPTVLAAQTACKLLCDVFSSFITLMTYLVFSVVEMKLVFESML